MSRHSIYFQISLNLLQLNNKRTVSCTGTSTGQNFIIGCRYFLKGAGCIKLLVGIKNSSFVAGTFLPFIFLLPCDILVTCLCPIFRVLV